MGIFDSIDELPEPMKRAYLTYRDRIHWSLEPQINQISNEDHSAPPALQISCSNRLGDQKSLGYLNTPYEIFEMIAAHLDVQSLRNLSATSSQMHNFVASLKKYQVIQNHLPGLLSLLTRTLVLPYFSITQIYSVLTNEECTACGRFGGLVFLLTMQRCCSQCAINKLQFSPMTPTAATRKHGLSKSALNTIPKLHGIPGNYGNGRGNIKLYKGKHVMVSRGDAQRLGKIAQKEECEDRAGFEHVYQRNMCLAPVPVLRPQTGFVDQGRQCFGCWRAWEEHDELEDGCNFCSGLLPDGTELDVEVIDSKVLEEYKNKIMCSCKYGTQRDRLYSQESIADHIAQCPNAQAELSRHVNWLKDTIETNEFVKEIFVAANEIFRLDFWTTVMLVESQPHYCDDKLDNFVRKTGRALKGLVNFKNEVRYQLTKNPKYEPDDACWFKFALNQGSPRKKDTR